MNRKRQPKKPHVWAFAILCGFGLLAFAMSTWLTLPALAAAAEQGEKRGDDFCLACHQQDNVAIKFGSETLSATINPVQFDQSVHKKENVGCVDCHANISDYPHPVVKEKSIRAFSLAQVDSCKDCHADQYTQALDGVHQAALNDGNEKAPICSDCHNPHTQPRLIGQTSGELSISARKHLAENCAQCHSETYTQYKNSVHGAALADGNTDVPTCTDCHGVHNINDPKTNSFRNNIPALCADCHDNAEIMDKYGISTQVLETYVADFHGTTVTVFEKQFPGQETNKAVCIDCHGAHDIAKVDNPQTGIALRENLLIKCQRCHPDATANFSSSWMSHYEASPERFPIVYYVNLFYKIMIPAILGGMIFFILTDIYRRMINRRKGEKHS